jgi:diguanylate cyclase (GGDEF)-like protein
MVLFDITSGDVGFWIGISVAAFALLVVSALLLLVLRTRQRETRRFETALRESSTRVEGLLSGITGSFELARVETDRARRLSEIGATIDLDEVLQRTLEAIGELPIVDAAMIVLPDAGKPVVATMGLSEDEARANVQQAEPPEDVAARAVDFTFRYDEDDESPNGSTIRGGLATPMRDDAGVVLGTLWVYWRGQERKPDDGVLTEVEEVAAAAAPAIENARRFQEARQLADLDALTGLHNYRFFHETLEREAARAQRYQRQLALIVFDIDDFKSVNDRIGHLAGDAVLAEAAAQVQSVVRSADIASRVGGDEFAVILPESSLEDAENFYRRLQLAIDTWQGAGIEVKLSAGIAQLRPDDDSVSFFQRADDALYEAKRRGKGQAVSAHVTDPTQPAESAEPSERAAAEDPPNTAPGLDQ